MADPENYQYDIDVSEVAEQGRGSVVGSWLLDLTADVLRMIESLASSMGRSDSGEGRWTVHSVVDLGVPASVINMLSSQDLSQDDLVNSQTKS